jgi:hypothetical protein
MSIVHRRLARGMTLVAIALCSATVPLQADSVARGSAEPSRAGSEDARTGPGPSIGAAEAAAEQGPPCESAPAAVTPPTATDPTEATFRLGGEPDPDVERAIEQLIGGRGFSVTLVSRGDGCADLTVAVGPDASAGGRSKVTRIVSSGSGSVVSSGSGSVVSSGSGSVAVVSSSFRSTSSSGHGSSSFDATISVGAGRTLSVQIVSENGATRASIGVVQ